MIQRELIDYCTDDANGCDVCPYDAECDVYVDVYGTTPACEKRAHPERYTDEDIGLMDGELAIREQPTIQPEERTAERAESHACDTIYRQAAIDALDCINGAEEVLRSLPPAQPEEAIPVSWIEGEIAEMKSTGKTLPYMLAELIGAMVRKWREDDSN